MLDLMQDVSFDKSAPYWIGGLIVMTTKRLLVVLLALLLGPSCLAVTITVDDDDPAADYANIQDAINAASDYDVVLVSPGHYYENIDFRGKPITVTSTAPTDPNTVADTIIDANNNGIVVSFHTDEGPNSVITGFTITGGHAKYGAGICCWDNCSPTISYCLITENHSDDIASSRGAGVHCQNNSNPALVNCAITANLADSSGGGLCSLASSPTITDSTLSANTADNGGGLYCSGNSRPMLVGCTITENSAYWGAGLCCRSSASPKITDCAITNNAARYGGGVYCNQESDPGLLACTITANSALYYGGGIFSNMSNPTLTGCTVTGNSADDRGGGLYCDQSSPRISECLIAGNSAVDGYGGALCCEDASSPIIRNCTLTGNWAPTGGGGVDCGEGCDAVITNNIICNSVFGSGIYALYCDPIISYNNVWGNADGDYGGWAWPGIGNISVDPCFIDPGHGDYHLHYDSLCINAGDPNYIADPCDVDIDGDPRIRLGRVDIGADETGSNPADFDENGFVDVVDYSTLTAAWQTDPNDLQWNPLCDIAAPADDFIDIADLCATTAQWLWQAPWR